MTQKFKNSTLCRKWSRRCSLFTSYNMASPVSHLWQCWTCHSERPLHWLGNQATPVEGTVVKKLLKSFKRRLNVLHGDWDTMTDSRVPCIFLGLNPIKIVAIVCFVSFSIVYRLHQVAGWTLLVPFSLQPRYFSLIMSAASAASYQRKEVTPPPPTTTTDLPWQVEKG